MSIIFENFRLQNRLFSAPQPGLIKTRSYLSPEGLEPWLEPSFSLLCILTRLPHGIIRSVCITGSQKALVTILCALRTGIARPNMQNRIRNGYLYGFDPDLRTTGGEHIIFVCGWSRPFKDGEENNWKPNLEAVWATMNYTIRTSRLDD